MEVWADQLPLYIWSGGEKADLTPVKAAKLALGVEMTVKPIGVTGITQLPKLTSRVLAIGSRPPFVCDYALTSERTSDEGWQRALSWALHITEHDPKATTTEDIMISVFGPGTREIPEAELVAAIRMREYQKALA